MTTWKGTLTRIESRENHPHRTTTVTGTTQRLPTVGEQFVIYSSAMKSRYNFRRVGTSTVVRIEQTPDGIDFWTEAGSQYRFEETT